MRTGIMCLFATAVLVLASCGTGTETDGSANGGNGVATTAAKAAEKLFAQDANGTTEDGLNYEITRGGEANDKVAKIGDYLSMHLEYRTANDSVIYSSKKRGKPIEFKFAETLFRGVINSGISMMTKGDKGVFRFPAEKMYGPENIPSFINTGDELIYVVELIDVRKAADRRAPSQRVQDAPDTK